MSRNIVILERSDGIWMDPFGVGRTASLVSDDGTTGAGMIEMRMADIIE